MFASYCSTLLLSLATVFSLVTPGERREGAGINGNCRWETGLRRGTMFVREYIYTFIHGQPAFTEVTLIVNRRLSSLPTHRRGTRRDAQIKGPTTLGYAARRQRAGSGCLLNKQRHTHRTHMFLFSFFLLKSDNHTATAENGGLVGLDSTLQQCPGKPATTAQGLHAFSNRLASVWRYRSMRHFTWIDGVIQHSRTFSCKGDTQVYRPSHPTQFHRLSKLKLKKRRYL